MDLARAAHRAATDAGVEAICAEAAVLEAHGHAIARDEAACASALDRAEHALDRADGTRDPQWIGYFDEVYRLPSSGIALPAQRFASRSLDMDGRYVRGRQFNLALLATAHAETGEIEQASAVDAQAADATEGLRSGRALDYLAQLAGRLAPHVGLPAVQEFSERARPLLQPAGGPGEQDSQ